MSEETEKQIEHTLERLEEKIDRLEKSVEQVQDATKRYDSPKPSTSANRPAGEPTTHSTGVKIRAEDDK